MAGALAGGWYLFALDGDGNSPAAEAPTTATVTSEASATASATATRAPTATVVPLPAAYDAARRLLRDGAFTEAARAYLDLAARETDPAVIAHALTGAAVAQNDGGDRAASIATLTEAIETAPAGSSAALEARYLLGVRLLEADEPREALTALAPVTDIAAGHVLEHHLLVAYAAAAARSGDFAEAEATWARLEVDADVSLGMRAEVAAERAELAARQDDDEARAVWLARYVELAPSAEARLRLALAADAVDDTATRDAQFMAILEDYPGTSASIIALEALEAQDVPVDDNLAGFVLYRAGDATSAKERLEDPPAANIAPADRVFRTYYLAASYEGLGDFERAIELYDAAAAIEAETPFTHRALWWAARLTEDLGDAEGASQRYLALATEGPAGEFSEEAAFRAGFVFVQAGEPELAAAAWASVELSEDPRLLYWRGRALADSGDATGTHDAYSAAVAAAPFSFHGVEAARELGMPAPDPTVYTPLPEVTAPDWAALDVWLASVAPGEPVLLPVAATVEGLMLLGLRREAAEVLDGEVTDAGPWELLALARIASEAGLTRQTIAYGQQLRLSLGLSTSEVPVDLLRLEYPLEYVVLLDDLARQYGFDPLWLASLVRQESLWDPRAGSVAGALGLTQVIPETGASIAAALGDDGFVTSDLFLPATSLSFGAYYLDAQLDSFGDPYVALSAYNAGPGNGSRWQTSNASGKPADFVERIDFSETYHYVQLVTEHHAHYIAAYRAAAADGAAQPGE